MSIPSDYAHSVIGQLKSTPEVLVDLGGGNGRDSIFFTNYCEQVLYVDQVDGLDSLPSLPANLSKVIGHLDSKSTWQEICNFICDKKSLYFYARFLVHALNLVELEEFLKNVSAAACNGNLFFLEYRIEDPEVILNYDNHARIYYEPNVIRQKFANLAWAEVSTEVGKGFAIYKNEDPMICRQVFTKVIL